MTEDEKRVLARQENITLDGQRAVIYGVRNQHATIAALPNGPTVEYAWPTVQRIVQRDGAFHTT